MSAVIYDHRFASSMPQAARQPVARTRLRLTRRGRAVIAVLVSLPLVIALVGLSINGGGATATSSDANAAAVSITTVTVEAGQSLWSLAGVIAPDASTADVVADLMAVNALESASVRPGQQLIVPEWYLD